MPLTFNTPRELWDFLPSEPEFDADSAAWVPVSRAAMLVQMSDAGTAQLRKRMGYPYEHKVKNRVYVYFPLWFRLYDLDQSNR